MDVNVTQDHERRSVRFRTLKHVFEFVEERIRDGDRAGSIYYDDQNVQLRSVNVTAENFERVEGRLRDITYLQFRIVEEAYSSVVTSCTRDLRLLSGTSFLYMTVAGRCTGNDVWTVRCVVPCLNNSADS